MRANQQPLFAELRGFASSTCCNLFKAKYLMQTERGLLHYLTCNTNGPFGHPGNRHVDDEVHDCFFGA